MFAKLLTLGGPLPTFKVVYYKKEDQTIPVLDWLDGLDREVKAKCLGRIELLGEQGYRMRRPLADSLRDGIHELRIVYGRANYRILYFFHKTKAIILSHGFLKKGSKVPDKQIETAIRYSESYKANPKRHTYQG